MTGDILPDLLGDFETNLRWLREDRKLEKSGLKIDIYFDTADVRDSTLGWHAYDVPEGEVGIRQRFDMSRTLVQCLASAGWLGEIKMLEPHQAEFLTLLDFNFGLPEFSESELEQRQNSFLASVSAHGLLYRATGAEHVRNRQIDVNAIAEEVGSAEKLFRLIQLLRHGHWRQRLRSMPLKIEKEQHDLTALLGRGEFRRVYDEFMVRRPPKIVPNVTDAAAVTQLVQMVEDYHTNGNHLPIFFVSTALFEDAVRHANVADKLSYVDSSGQLVPVLRSAKYFIYRSIFCTPEDVISEAAHSRFSIDDLDLLFRLAKRYIHYRDIPISART